MLPAPSTLTVPTQHLSLHEVLIPPTPAHRLQAALAGALEEQLLDDPADLHFALLPSAQADSKAGKQVQVLVCNKAWLQGLLDKASSGGNRITSIVPDDAALRSLGWDLAQGSFAPRGAMASGFSEAGKTLWLAPQWRAARIALLLLAVVHVVGLNLWAWRDRVALADKRAELGRILTQTFPKTQVVVDPAAQMAKAVGLLRAGSGALASTDLESQLASQAAGTSGGVMAAPLSQIDYQNNVLKVLP